MLSGRVGVSDGPKWNLRRAGRRLFNAGKRIAELEAEVEKLHAKLFSAVAEIESAQQSNEILAEELADEKAKRCETCRHWESTRVPPEGKSVCRSTCPVYVEEPPPDFACNRHEPKE